jgi:glycosyltransferase involved in cell wall biosynthesis
MVEVSIVVPLYNEEAVVQELYQRLVMALEPLRRSFEIVFVDDGSLDRTYTLALDIARKDPRVKLVKLRANFGQTGGIAAGIDHASGDIIIPMDGDLQHMPEDIPAFLAKIDDGYDVVSGWRIKRVDGLFLRRIPSKIANRLMRYLSGIDLHDFGTTFKAYRREAIRHVRLYGQFHRFIPVLCRGVMKLRITEIPIQNIVRPAGKSNYGLWRTFTVLFDLARLKFLMSFMQRPLQLFGSLAAVFILLALGIGGFIAYERVVRRVTLGVLGPSIFMAATTLAISGIMLFCVGLLAELMVKLYFDGNRARPYVVERITNELPRPIHPWPEEARFEEPPKVAQQSQVPKQKVGGIQ